MAQGNLFGDIVIGNVDVARVYAADDPNTADTLKAIQLVRRDVLEPDCSPVDCPSHNQLQTHAAFALSLWK